MRTIGRRGFTLIELLVALALGALVMGAVMRALVGTQRVTQGGMQKIDVQQNLRAGITYLASSLRELDATDGDIIGATPTRLVFRGMRWVGVLCAPPAGTMGTAVILPISRTSLAGLRGPDSGLDSVLVFRDGAAERRSDDSWLVGAVTGVAAGNCSDGTPAIRLMVEITPASGGAAAVMSGVTRGAPLRGFQAEELSLFQGAGSRWWMGQREANRPGAWTSVRALAGPVTTAGLGFAYFDTSGVATVVLTDIASVEVGMRAESWARIRGLRGGVDYARDSLATRVALRNNARF